MFFLLSVKLYSLVLLSILAFSSLVTIKILDFKYVLFALNII